MTEEAGAMSGDLQREFRYYLEHQDELVKLHAGKVLVIRGEQVVGVFDTDAEALREARRRFPAGTYILQRCSEGSEDYTQHFTSRACFV
jgi:hypothetical protein